MLIRSALAPPLIRLPAPSPRFDGEKDNCGDAECTIHPCISVAREIAQDRAAYAFSPYAGRRWRQPDEGPSPTFATRGANSGLR